jgi:alpha-galactosidase
MDNQSVWKKQSSKGKTHMPKITLIGAGSLVFTCTLCSDILLSPALQDSTITLMDIDPIRLTQAQSVIKTMIKSRGLKAHVKTTTDRRDAIRGADYVLTVFQQGGLEAYTLDITIPERFGVEQCVGDTLGPGGVFRALRTIPVLVDLCHDMDELAPDGLLINYVNPMAANCWGVELATHRTIIGLCHSVQTTAQLLSEWIDVPSDEVSYLCAGINHQAWYLTFRRGKLDLYPLIWKAIERPDVRAIDPVRVELMKHFGYFVTESSGHASEYLPYFRKNAEMVNQNLVPLFKDQMNFWLDYGRTGGYLRYARQRALESQMEYDERTKEARKRNLSRSSEYASWIIEAIETNHPICVNANVRNSGLIDNLPDGCCVEVPCLVDAKGVQPIKVGKLPTQLAALNRTSINVQELIVEAAVAGSLEAVYHAVMLDPLTAAVCTLPQIRAMVDELLAAEAQWLPQFCRRDKAF